MSTANKKGLNLNKCIKLNNCVNPSQCTNLNQFPNLNKCVNLNQCTCLNLCSNFFKQGSLFNSICFHGLSSCLQRNNEEKIQDATRHTKKRHCHKKRHKRHCKIGRCKIGLQGSQGSQGNYICL